MTEITEGMIIKATAPDGSEVHGFAMLDENMNFFITGEKPVLLDECTNIQLSEDAPKGEVVDQILNADIKKIDPKKIKDPEKVGAEREKELIKMKVLKGNEDYKAKFAAGVTIAKAMNGQGTGLFNKSTLDKYKKKESNEDMDNTWENFKEGDLEKNEAMPIEGDTIIGEKPVEDTTTDDILSTPDAGADVAVDSATDQVLDEPTAPITDMTINNAVVDDAAAITTPQAGDDILNSSDSITDYSEFLDTPSEDTIVDNGFSTTPEEDNLIADAVTADNTSTIANDDVQITIKNPSEKTIEIKINGEKEDALNKEIDDELDNFQPEGGYSDDAFFEHLCKKYEYQGKLEEGESISTAICKLIAEVANR